jgi:hypothetical protein
VPLKRRTTRYVRPELPSTRWSIKHELHLQCLALVRLLLLLLLVSDASWSWLGFAIEAWLSSVMSKDQGSSPLLLVKKSPFLPILPQTVDCRCGSCLSVFLVKLVEVEDCYALLGMGDRRTECKCRLRRSHHRLYDQYLLDSEARERFPSVCRDFMLVSGELTWTKPRMQHILNTLMRYSINTGKQWRTCTPAPVSHSACRPTHEVIRPYLRHCHKYLLRELSCSIFAILTEVVVSANRVT